METRGTIEAPAILQTPHLFICVLFCVSNCEFDSNLFLTNAHDIRLSFSGKQKKNSFGFFVVVFVADELQRQSRTFVNADR